MQQKMLRPLRQLLRLGGTKMCSAKMPLRSVPHNLLLALNVQAFQSKTHVDFEHERGNQFYILFNLLNLKKILDYESCCNSEKNDACLFGLHQHFSLPAFCLDLPAYKTRASWPKPLREIHKNV